MYVAVIFVFISLNPFCHGARILGIVGTPSISHQVPFQPIWKELSLRGHQVTVITTDPINDPALVNLTEINLHYCYELLKRFNFADMAETRLTEFIRRYIEFQIELQDSQLGHPDVKSLIEDRSKEFDVVMVEPLLPAMYAFATRFKAPLVQLFSIDAPGYFLHLIGNPSHPVINPEIMLPFIPPLSFFERVTSIVFYLYGTYFVQAQTNYLSELVMQAHFGEGYPSIEDIAKNTSLMFVNSNPILHPVRPLLPSIVQFGGGIHIQPLRPLPQTLQTRLDNAKQGFIYFSLGSNVKSKDLSLETRRAILEMVSELPYVVLWKFEEESLRNKPKNLIVWKWFPQQDILRHPNIKLFITQGGLQSLEEAIYSRVPIVGIPFIGDQRANVRRMVHKGIGVELNTASLTKESFKGAILEVINNPKYRNKVTELAELVKDQPMKGLDLAVWWTEYVIRHKGAEHLRSPAIDLPLYQYYLLDVIAFCLLMLFVVLYIARVLLRLVFKIVRYLTGRTATKMKTE